MSTSSGCSTSSPHLPRENWTGKSEGVPVAFVSLLPCHWLLPVLTRHSLHRALLCNPLLHGNGRFGSADQRFRHARRHSCPHQRQYPDGAQLVVQQSEPFAVCGHLRRAEAMGTADVAFSATTSNPANPGAAAGRRFGRQRWLGSGAVDGVPQMYVIHCTGRSSVGFSMLI